jgi:hypothetical protein
MLDLPLLPYQAGILARNASSESIGVIAVAA